ncbi:nucleotidyltransferase family protein [Aliisedimentitalea scapharcae]|uniref:Nucleotidyltransferase family protein n=1 Tax=Aliisedimentitalea scapharcae TaxID=1524259 RepID=A0ABZ2XSW5_9RHOB
MTLPVMLFAAGFGTRMRDLTRDRPKPLIKVDDCPLIDHTLGIARAVNPPRIVANTHYKPQMLADHLVPQGVIISEEQPDILDTGGGLRAALPVLGHGPIVTMNTDAIWSGPNPVQLALDMWNPDCMDALLVCVPMEQALGRQSGGDFSSDEHGRAFRGGNLVYGGVQILNPEGLYDIPDRVFSLNILWNAISAKNRLYCAKYPGKWCDVGHPEGIPLAETLLRQSDV